MEEIPKILRERLQQESMGPPQAAHPDANLLAALAENALGEGERREVLAHLTLCDMCREIVALALPPRESHAGGHVLGVPAGHRQVGWLGRQNLRWGALAATFVVAISLGLLFRSSERGNVSVRSDETMVQPAPKIVNEAAPGATNPSELRIQPAEPPASSADKGRSSAQQEESRQESQTHKKDARARTEEKNLASSSSSNAVRETTASGAGTTTTAIEMAPAPEFRAKVDKRETEGEHKADARRSNSDGAAIATGKSASSSSLKGQDVGAAEGSLQNSSIPGTPDQSSPAQRTASAATTESPDKDSADKLTAPAPPRESNFAVDPAQRKKLARAFAPHSHFRWNISATGRLQRSVPGWDINSESGEQWADVAVGEDITFRAVAVVGSSIWAGGTKRALFLSHDDGSTWSRIAGQWRGDIASINFNDSIHGELATSTGERWSTSDGGKHWTAP